MMPPPGDRLDSWKEVAAYLGRGVRTAHRWETDEGLPVHRHIHRAGSSVYAYKSEIDSWRQTHRGPAPSPMTTERRPAPSPGPVKSIAVLPFANLSIEADTNYFADGLT